MYRVLAALLCAVSGPALARDTVVSVPELIAKPQAYIRQPIVVRSIRCVDPGGSGFLCVAADGNKALRIDALLLGPLTTVSIAERLITRCKGAGALTRTECRVDITITPTSFEQTAGSGGPEAATVIHATEIEMATPGKR